MGRPPGFVLIEVHYRFSSASESAGMFFFEVEQLGIVRARIDLRQNLNISETHCPAHGSIQFGFEDKRIFRRDRDGLHQSAPSMNCEPAIANAPGVVPFFGPEASSGRNVADVIEPESPQREEQPGYFQMSGCDAISNRCT